MRESISGPSPHVRRHRLLLVISLGLVLLTFLAFFGVWKNDFINYDDNTYVFQNRHILSGLTLETVQWAFTSVNACHWVPLTWLSYALDSQLFGLNPAGFHVTNLVLHVANAVLLFFLLEGMTNSTWRSAFVAALFAVHPLRVESVAWVAERKDVLSGLFFMLTLLAYGHYVRLKRESLTRFKDSSQSEAKPLSQDPALYYIVAFGCFACGLMSKSMLVTAPGLLLLLDYWPLRRFELQTPSVTWKAVLPLVREKWPFFGLSVVVALITLLAEDTATNQVGSRPLPQRLSNAVLSCAAYVRQTFWPSHLSIFYPPEHVPLLGAKVLGLVGLLLVGTAFAALFARRYPPCFVGWFWYLGLLVPVSGIFEIGEMIQADRYTYLPAIGIYIVLAWGWAGLVSTLPRLKSPLAGLASAGVIILATVARSQIPIWRNTETVFAHAAKVTRDNFVALSALAAIDLDHGYLDKALTNLNRVLEIAPRYPRAEYLLGTALQMQGRMQEALPHFEAATGPEVFIPGKARTVLCLMDAGRFTEADAIMDQLLAVMPQDPNGLTMKAALLKEQGRLNEARRLFSRVTAAVPELKADNPAMNFQIAELYNLEGNNQRAINYYSKAIEAAPRSVRALNNLAWILATDPDDQNRDGRRAVELARRACEATDWKQPVILGTLAASYAEAGRCDEAVRMAERARDGALAAHLEEVAKRNSELLAFYRQGKPYRESRR